MLDLSILTSKIKGAVRTLIHGKNMDTNQSRYSLVIEADFEHEKYTSKLDEKDPSIVCPGTFLEGDEMQACQNVKLEIESALKDSFEKDRKCKVILPMNLVSRVSEDVVRMSLAEPCGVRGCAIYVMLQGKGKSERITTIYGNPSLPPTFEIHLTLREDTRSWKTLQKMFLTLKGCILNSHWSAMPKILCSAYQLEKRRLYRSSSTNLCVQVDH